MHHPHRSAARRSRDDESGASLVEYALLLALIAVVVFSAVSFFGSETGGGFGRSASCIQAAYSDAIDDECP
jgi:Flp pilus assembly pilin Flp